ncbi:MAG: alpha/beta hydrolase, partial [Planctomycetota bacterium]
MANSKPAFLCIILLMTSGLVAQESRTKEQPRGNKTNRSQAKYLKTAGERKLEVVYKEVSAKKLRLDLYYPADHADKERPVVIFTHGGGWAAGSRYKAASGLFAIVFSRLIEQGFVVAPVTYRLAKKGSGVTMRDCVIDCKDAVRYLAKNAKTLGIDPKRFCVMGDSAGGHLAQMLLLTAPEQLPGDPELSDATYKMIAGVSWYGPCDFEKMNLFNHDDRTGFKDRFGPRILGASLDPADKLSRYREVSPINYLR